MTDHSHDKAARRAQERDQHRARFSINQPLSPGADIELDKDIGHHLATVLRAKVGDVIELFNGDGHNHLAELSTLDNKGRRVTARIIESTEAHTESSLDITVVQAISRGDKMDRSLRQATELGARAFQPLYSELAIKPLDAKRAARKQEHWQSIVKSAAEQSGRTRVPEVAEPLSWRAWIEHYLERPQGRGEVLMLVPGATLSLMAAVANRGASPLVVLIGPESGFSTAEIQEALALGITGVHLGPRVLRTETAAPAVLAALHASIGDFQ